ncbi:hypothetical protein M409DRAFT_54280 [Zasmidium cellare ATCC 36951]|uniref:Uncharacterized protein n=1 Tax=Zasmidium cellare ATCC 36951 TaxID=1080233 RepID=A0A6A6CLN9_ZASCE|nr:uncharacterized protein M409DRAFT_54280 [Zasmidium cellare ATCC 36951]KAF2167070.1 hypothetical protein M409DRAFT_54280 [Zasmidium cellare ATCC 36951]
MPDTARARATLSHDDASRLYAWDEKSAKVSAGRQRRAMMHGSPRITSQGRRVARGLEGGSSVFAAEEEGCIVQIDSACSIESRVGCWMTELAIRVMCESAAVSMLVERESGW